MRRQCKSRTINEQGGGKNDEIRELWWCSYQAVGSQWDSKIITSNLIPQPSKKKLSVYFFKNKSLQKWEFNTAEVHWSCIWISIGLPNEKSYNRYYCTILRVLIWSIHCRLRSLENLIVPHSIFNVCSNLNAHTVVQVSIFRAFQRQLLKILVNLSNPTYLLSALST